VYLKRYIHREASYTHRHSTFRHPRVTQHNQIKHHTLSETDQVLYGVCCCMCGGGREQEMRASGGLSARPIYYNFSLWRADAPGWYFICCDWCSRAVNCDLPIASIWRERETHAHVIVNWCDWWCSLTTGQNFTLTPILFFKIYSWSSHSQVCIGMIW
jgi:hypothetical protein